MRYGNKQKKTQENSQDPRATCREDPLFATYPKAGARMRLVSLFLVVLRAGSHRCNIYALFDTAMSF
jgi:hypothetical protein